MYFFILPMTYYNFPAQPHPGHYKTKFTVSVSTLIQVHKVHVNTLPWDIAIELSVQMKQRFPQYLKATNPHFSWRKSVHPCNYSNTVLAGIGITDTFIDLIR